MTKKVYGTIIRLTLLAIIVVTLIMSLYVKTEAVPIGVMYIKADSVVDGNIFYVTIALNGASDIAGGQGMLHYDATKLRLLEFAPHLPEGWAWDMYDKNGEVSFLFYIDREKEKVSETQADTSESNEPREAPTAENGSTGTENDTTALAVSTTTADEEKNEIPDDGSGFLNDKCELFNLYFQIENEPQDKKLSLWLDKVLLSDTISESSCPQSNVSIIVDNYVPPVTTAPSVTDTESNAPETERNTSEVTEKITTAERNTNEETEKTTESDQITVTESDIVRTVGETEYVGKSVGDGNEIRIIHVIAVAVVCTVISGGVVYFAMKRKADKK